MIMSLGASALKGDVHDMGAAMFGGIGGHAWPFF